MERSRNFCFTINNYTEDVLNSILDADCTYIIVGKEKGEECGTPHLQGFVSFKNARSLKNLKKINATAHWEIARGTPQQNRDYCSKQGDFQERGVIPMDQKAKGDCEKDRWAHIIQLSEAGDWDTLKLEYPVEYGQKLKNLEHINKKRKKDVSTLDGELPHQWFVGETGCGKSKRARDENPGAFVKDPTSKWWDGYDGQDVVIIDDFDKYQVSQGGDMKRWLDRYAFQAQFKGGYEFIRPKKVIVTSQYTPAEIWEDTKTVDAIMRRVKMETLGPPRVYPIFAPSFVPPVPSVPRMRLSSSVPSHL